MITFTDVFVGIGREGARIINGITADGVKVTVNPAYYILRPERYSRRLEEFFGSLPENTMLWIFHEDNAINAEIRDLIVSTARNTPNLTLLAYVLTPHRELINEEKPSWANSFDTVFYDSLGEFLQMNVPLREAYERAAGEISSALSNLYRYLEGQMLVNVDYADFFTIVRGGNVGILRKFSSTDIDWRWGVWERGLVIAVVNENFKLSEAHRILSEFQELLSEKDIIWGVSVNPGTERVEVLALLVKRWQEV
ncbi:MAG: hypothetical protein GXO14_00465 [Thermococci archaeon]|nr:hypothetical protein [Thermococci archaeon]